MDRTVAQTAGAKFSSRKSWVRSQTNLSGIYGEQCSYWQDLPCWTGQRVGVRRIETPKLMPEAASSVAA